MNGDLNAFKGPPATLLAILSHSFLAQFSAFPLQTLLDQPNQQSWPHSGAFNEVSNCAMHGGPSGTPSCCR
ncbi:hypothetical protein F5Y17DRAFT_392144 [Xylariaceae sp. FL0594]|nr:hypothetical protein F5Y17DRAFT_392144 [Xylariaceae sp. FL0594]